MFLISSFFKQRGYERQVSLIVMDEASASETGPARGCEVMLKWFALHLICQMSTNEDCQMKMCL